MPIKIHEETYYYNIVRKNIKRYRKQLNLTQQQLADRCGLSMNYIAKIESDKMERGFTLGTLGRIADSLEIDIAELFKK